MKRTYIIPQQNCIDLGNEVCLGVTSNSDSPEGWASTNSLQDDLVKGQTIIDDDDTSSNGSLWDDEW